MVVDGSIGGSMIHQMSRRITRSLINNDIINFDDVSIYQYGMEVMLAAIVEMIGVLVLAVLTGYVIEAAVFLFAFSSVRVYAGGYHAPTVMKCFMVIVALLATAITICSNIDVEKLPMMSILISLVAFGIVYIYAPVSVKNRPLSDEEKIKYRRIAINITFVHLLFVTVLSMANVYSWYVSFFSMGLLFEALTLVFEKQRKEIVR